MLNINVISKIIEYLNIFEIYYLFLSSSNTLQFNNLLQPKVIKFNTNKIIFENINIPEYLKTKISILLLYNNKINYDISIPLYNSKEIDINNYRINTDYIDYITDKNFLNTNIIYGYDFYRRFFIALRYDKIYDNITTKDNIIVFFQRYTNNPTYYVNCQTSFTDNNSVTTYNFDSLIYPNENFQGLFNLLIYGKYKLLQNNIYYEINLS